MFPIQPISLLVFELSFVRTWPNPTQPNCAQPNPILSHTPSHPISALQMLNSSPNPMVLRWVDKQTDRRTATQREKAIDGRTYRVLVVLLWISLVVYWSNDNHQIGTANGAQQTTLTPKGITPRMRKKADINDNGQGQCIDNSNHKKHQLQKQANKSKCGDGMSWTRYSCAPWFAKFFRLDFCTLKNYKLIWISWDWLSVFLYGVDLHISQHSRT